MVRLLYLVSFNAQSFLARSNGTASLRSALAPCPRFRGYEEGQKLWSGQMEPSGWMEPGGKDRSSECIAGVTLGNEAGGVCSRKDDVGGGQERRSSMLLVFIQDQNIYCDESGTRSTQTEIPF